MAKAGPKNTRSVATIQTPAAEAAGAKRSRTLISAEDVASVFNDDCISRLAKLSGLDDYISRPAKRSGFHVVIIRAGLAKASAARCKFICVMPQCVTRTTFTER
jgi:hypothetical protein